MSEFWVGEPFWPLGFSINCRVDNFFSPCFSKSGALATVCFPNEAAFAPSGLQKNLVCLAFRLSKIWLPFKIMFPTHDFFIFLHSSYHAKLDNSIDF